MRDVRCRSSLAPCGIRVVQARAAGCLLVLLFWSDRVAYRAYQDFPDYRDYPGLSGLCGRARGALDGARRAGLVRRHGARNPASAMQREPCANDSIWIQVRLCEHWRKSALVAPQFAQTWLDRFPHERACELLVRDAARRAFPRISPVAALRGMQRTPPDPQDHAASIALWRTAIIRRQPPGPTEAATRAFPRVDRQSRLHRRVVSRDR